MIEERTRQQFERSVLARLAALGRRVRWYALVDGAAPLALAMIIAMAATLMIDRSFWLGRDMRTVQLLTILGVLAALAWFFIIRPLRVPVGASELALLIEHHFPHLQSRLITAVEFAAPDAAARHTDVPRSQDFIDAVMRQAQREFDPL